MPDPAPGAVPRLFLLDGSALAYRSHFAFAQRPLTGPSGEVVSAIYAFVNSLLKILDQERPTHLAVVFDAKGETFRHQMYRDYKATRPPIPTELKNQLPAIRALVEAFSIPVLEEPGVEADDVIGTLAADAARRGFDVRIVSPDKDFCQLVGERIKLYSQGQRSDVAETIDRDGVRRKFGIGPEQMVDWLALVGDSSDNVPGVERIGEKTASELIVRHGDLDSIYQDLDRVEKSGVRKALAEGRESAYLSRRLVTLHTDLKLPVTIESLSRKEPDLRKVRDLFQRHGFRSLLQRLGEPALPPSSTTARNYELADTEDKLLVWTDRLRKAPLVVVDTETTDIDPLRAELVGISFCAEEGRAGFIPLKFAANLFEASGGERLGRGWEEFRRLLSDEKVRKAGQNIKYDWHVLERHGLDLKGVVFDTMLAHYCVEPSAQSHGIDALSLEYFHHTKIKTTELIGTGKNRRTMDQVPVAQVCEYACEDADYTFRLVAPLKSRMRELEVEQLFETIEMPLLDVLRRMEKAGVSIDFKSLKELGGRLTEASKGLVKEIHVLAGEPFNVNSPRQLAEILFDKLAIHKELGITRLLRTKSGMSTSAEALEPLAAHPLIAKILEYRQIEKLNSTYVEALPRLIHPETGKIHTSFNQSVAATGRLSSSDPNLQNIPVRTTLGREIRRAFRASHPEGTLVSADYSQIELRILAQLAEDEALLDSFRAGLDIHRSTAARIFHLSPEKVGPELRSRAKAINFGIIYGMGAPRLARETGITVKEAQAFIERYFEVFAGVKRYLDHTVEQARSLGYVTTLFGRRRYIPEMSSSDRRVAANARNIAVNTPIQGTAADLIKKAMIRVDQRLREQRLQSQMILQVHDELLFDVVPGESKAVRAIAKESMEGAIDMSVPLRVEIGEGPTWLDAH